MLEKDKAVLKRRMKNCKEINVERRCEKYISRKSYKNFNFLSKKKKFFPLTI